MDLLNNLNVVISIIVGIFGIGGYIVGIVVYLRGKATPSQQKQSAQQNASQKQYSYQAPQKPLSRLDWMEVLWNGFEDYLKAFTEGESKGCFASIAIPIFGGIISAFILASNSIIAYILVSLFVIIFVTVHILFYVYFVGRRLEKRIENNVQTIWKN